MYDFVGYEADWQGQEPNYRDGSQLSSYSSQEEYSVTFAGGNLPPYWPPSQPIPTEQEIEDLNLNFATFFEDYFKAVENGDEFTKVMDDLIKNNNVDNAAAAAAIVADARDGDHDAFFEKYGRRFDEDQFQFVWDYPKIYGLDDLGELVPPSKGYVEVGPTWAEDGEAPDWFKKSLEEDGPTPAGGGSGGDGGYAGSSGIGAWSGTGFGGGDGPSVHIGPISVVEEQAGEIPD